MLANYFPILLFIIVGAVVGLAPIILGGVAGRLLGVHKPDSEKLSPYECGFNPIGIAPRNFNIKFYIIAILFIIFDLEVAFLFPWAVTLKEVGVFGFWSMMIFLGVLTIGFVYEWKKGALEWD